MGKQKRRKLLKIRRETTTEKKLPDITECKQMKNALRDQYRWFQFTLSSIGDVVIATDINGNIIFMNSAAEEFTGYTKAESIGRPIADVFNIIHKETGDPVEIAIHKALQTGGVVEPRNYAAIIPKDGSERSILDSAAPIRNDGGEIIGAVIVFKDITERRKAELELKLKEAKFILENARNIMLFIRPDGCIIEANQAAASFYGYRREELLSMTINELSRTRTNHIAGDGTSFETIHYCKDGTAFPVEVSSHSTTLINGHALLYIIRDTTRCKQTNKALKESLENVRRTLEGVVNALAATVEKRDPYTAGHQRRVARLASLIAETMGLPDEKVEGVRVAALLHDIGKIFVPSDILNKPCRLTDIEMSLMREHVRIGYDIIKTIPFSSPIAQFILQHHERVNGSGYPLGLFGGEILLESKIIGVADVVEAMSSHRPYRPAHGMKKALMEITCNKGILYDLDVVEACLQTVNTEGFKLE